MSAADRPRVQSYGDGAILVTFGDRIGVSLSRRIGALVAALDELAAEGRLAGVIDLVPSYTTLVAILDPNRIDANELGDIILALWNDLDLDLEATTGRVVEIPVCYGGEHGPDLDAIVAHTGLTRDEVIGRHSSGQYVVGALGFSPGFAFLIGLDPSLVTPRRATPRTAVPAGSVGIGGAQTGVYAQATPGGWSLLGRTPLRLARTELADPTEAFLLRSGDAVRFVPIDANRFAEITADLADDAFDEDRLAETTGPDAVLEVLDPGLQTTVQDLGRPQFGRYGISPGGAADRGSLIAANRALGNPDDAAALEITLRGPALRAMQPVRIALAGADLGAMVNGHPVPPLATIVLRPADVFAFDPKRARGDRRGLRAYLAVAGGVDVPLVMGSRSTDLTAGMGGISGRSLQAGDAILAGLSDPQPIGDGDPRIVGTWPTDHVHGELVVHVVRGPHDDRFDVLAWETFLRGVFTVSPQSNRMGLRLDGPAITPTGGADLISEGMVTGAIQVTNGGQPIVMLPARATIGGYATIATVTTSDLDRLGQAAPGTRIRFREVSVDDARAIGRDAHSRGEGGPATASGDRDEVLSLIRDFPTFGLASLDLEIPAAGIRLRIDA